jgi:hypothetical protein
MDKKQLQKEHERLKLEVKKRDKLIDEMKQVIKIERSIISDYVPKRIKKVIFERKKNELKS